MDYVIYRASNGEILRSFTGPADDLAHQLGAGEAAAVGAGCWLTHRVVDEVVLALAEPRQPPFVGAAWDADLAAWFDPLLRADTAAAARIDRRAVLCQQIVDQEQRQARPMREIEVARLMGRAMPQRAVAAVQDIEAAITSLRAQLAALA